MRKENKDNTYLKDSSAQFHISIHESTLQPSNYI